MSKRVRIGYFLTENVCRGLDSLCTVKTDVDAVGCYGKPNRWFEQYVLTAVMIVVNRRACDTPQFLESVLNGRINMSRRLAFQMGVRFRPDTIFSKCASEFGKDVFLRWDKLC